MRSTGRPALISEFGADEPNTNYNTYQPTHLHNGLWAGLSSGGMMSPLLWCDEGNFPMLTDPKIVPDDGDKALKNRLLAFRDGCHYRWLMEAYAKPKTPIATHDFKTALQYWLGKSPGLDHRTKSNIDAGVSGILHTYNTGIVRDLLATETTISPEVMEQRKWALVNMPIVAGDAESTFVNAALKYITQRHILRRKAKETDPIIGIWSDEFPKVANDYDAAALAEIRSHKGFMVTLAQSMPGMIAALGGDKNNASALLCNQYVKIFHMLGEAETAEFASSLLGKERQITINGSEGSGKSYGDELFGESAFTSSFNEGWAPVLQPAAFLGNMRTGGKSSNYMVDAILIRGGTYRFVEFSQR